jgi:hypothetical protein
MKWYGNPAFIAAPTCLGNLHHFVTGTLTHIYEVMEVNHRLYTTSGEVGRHVMHLLFTQDVHKKAESLPGESGCYNHERYQAILYALPIRRVYTGYGGRHQPRNVKPRCSQSSIYALVSRLIITVCIFHIR